MRRLHLFGGAFATVLAALLWQSFSCSPSPPFLCFPTFSPFRGSSSLLSPLSLFLIFHLPVDRLFGRPPFSVGSRLGRPFWPPGLFWSLCAVRQSLRRLFCRPASTSGTLVSAWFYLLSFGRLFYRPIASLAALCMCRLLGRYICRLLGS